ncbi:hypothetical protein [uncultured Roseibium sp.]|uniref:hypothetical protein n=1 Tax=uncultured Roseibium sp. TaxID=1936171 RepID=UPI003217084B
MLEKGDELPAAALVEPVGRDTEKTMGLSHFLAETLHVGHSEIPVSDGAGGAGHGRDSHQAGMKVEPALHGQPTISAP